MESSHIHWLHRRGNKFMMTFLGIHWHVISTPSACPNPIFKVSPVFFTHSIEDSVSHKKWVGWDRVELTPKSKMSLAFIIFYVKFMLSCYSTIFLEFLLSTTQSSFFVLSSIRPKDLPPSSSSGALTTKLLVIRWLWLVAGQENIKMWIWEMVCVSLGVFPFGIMILCYVDT